MNGSPKARCPKCHRKLTLELKGTDWVVPSHNIRKLGEVNPECSGTGVKMK